MVLWWAVTNLTFCKNLSNCHVVESNYSLLSHYLCRQDSSSVCMNTIHSIYACYRSAVGSSLSFKSLFRLQNEGWDRIFTITDRHHSKSTGQWTRNHNILLWHCYRVSRALWRTKSLSDPQHTRMVISIVLLYIYYLSCECEAIVAVDQYFTG